MYNKDIKVKIFNPNIATTISVPQFDSVKEAIKVLGKQHCLEVINKHSVFTSRIEWNNRIIKELVAKRQK